MRGVGIRCITAALLLALAVPGGAQAHARSESFSHWSYHDGTVLARFTIDAREVTRISSADQVSGPDRALARYLDTQIEVFNGRSSCRPEQNFRPVEVRPGFAQAVARWRCDGPPDRIVVNAFFDLAAEHTHIATLAFPGLRSRHLLSSDQRAWKPRDRSHGDARTSRNLADFVKLGFRHIISGPDHVLFLLVLLIACRRPREIFWAVSGFTLGHSVTLSLAATGLIEPNLPAVEATIGLTIALLALERAALTARHALFLALAASGFLALLALRSSWLPGLQPAFLAPLSLFVLCYLLLAPETAGNSAIKALVTTLFGLVHGLGFATAFQAAGSGSEEMLWPLAGFNIGVELGQLVLVGIMGAGALALRMRPRLAAMSAELSGAAACAMGLYWFLERGLS